MSCNCRALFRFMLRVRISGLQFERYESFFIRDCRIWNSWRRIRRSTLQWLVLSCQCTISSVEWKPGYRGSTSLWSMVSSQFRGFRYADVLVLVGMHQHFGLIFMWYSSTRTIEYIPFIAPFVENISGNQYACCLCSTSEMLIQKPTEWLKYVI